MSDLFVANIRPNGQAPCDVLVQNGRFAAFGNPVAPPGTATIDGGGRLMLPGLVEAHTHLDKTLWGMDWHPHSSGPRLIDKIEGERALRKTLDIDPARQSERQALQASKMGTTHIRSHVDVDTEVGLGGIRGVAATRAKLAQKIDIQIVAFPQSGLLIRPGTAALMDAALAEGADAVGGLDPSAIDRDPKGHLDVVFGLAQNHAKPVDIHLHEPAELGAFSLELIVERTRALGMQGKVMLGHAFCLGMADQTYARTLLDLLAREDIAVMTTGAASRPVPGLRECAAAGVVLCGGSDGIRDAWSPYGNADMLERAMLIGLRNNCRRDDELEMALAACTTNAARALGLGDYGLAPGCPADFVLVDGQAVAHAVVARPAARATFKAGQAV